MPHPKDITSNIGNYADLDYSGIYQFTNEDDSEQWGSFEVFQGKDCLCFIEDEYGRPDLDKWYYWSCFPGCLPDSDPIGPFDTSAEAYHDAQGF